ncbi:MAG TPA: farnesyl diphosphate synthase [Gemmataceae bacterium]|nr:farnesyl diphosphate synthase [Gemmataceae bacterium]
MHDLSRRLIEIKARVEDRLREVLHPEPGFPESLREAMRYSLLAPGKRLRPALVVLAAEACGQGGDPWPAACAVEMIHAYSLIHDDLPAMDDDDLRRGQPTCHKKFGEALAILAGDALQTTAFQVLAEGYPPTTAAAATKELARAAGPAGMIGGQVDDMAWSVVRRPSSVVIRNEEQRTTDNGQRTMDLERLHARKTGALIRASLRLGALAAYAPDMPPAEVVERLDGYGRRLGLAFQITDDLLDVEGSADSTGKRVGKDAGRGKLTYPGLLGADESRRRAERLCREAREQVAPLGTAADPLLALAAYVLERDR